MEKSVQKRLLEGLTLTCRHLSLSIQEEKLKTLIQIECLLHYCFCYEEAVEVDKAYYLLLNQHKLGRIKRSHKSWLLDNLRVSIYALTSSFQYKHSLAIYISLPENLRLYKVVENHLEVTEAREHNSDRVCLYEEMIHTPYSYTRANLKQSREEKAYYFEKKGIQIPVNFTDFVLDEIIQPIPRPKRGETFTITIGALLSYAEEIDVKLEEIISNRGAFEQENYKQRLEHITLLKNKGSRIQTADELTIQEVCHMIGMVGSGKSTLMVVLAYAAAKQGYRICLVLEGIKDVLSMYALYKALGICTSYVTGESSIPEQIEKVAEEGHYYLESKYASLTAGCLVDGMIAPQDSFVALDYGQEPCYSLHVKKNKSKYLCPLYNKCPKKRNEQEMAEADIVITHIHSLIYGKSYVMPGIGRIPFLYYLIDYFDLAIFDEADKLLVGLDKAFSKEVKIKEFLIKHTNNLGEVAKKIIQTNDVILLAFYNYYNHMFNSLSTIRELVETRACIRDIPILKSGKWFTGNMLVRAEFAEHSTILEDLIKYSEEDVGNHVTDRTKAMIVWMESREDVEVFIKENYDITNDEMDKFIFIFTLMFLEKTIIEMGNTIDKMDESALIGVEIIDVIRSPFRRIRTLIPTAPLGNLFGYVYDREENDLTIFRQFGLGRSVMLDLPYLKVDNEGNPLGPSILCLSGTSFAEGSPRYHIPKPVQYIIKSPQEIIDFINKTQVVVLPTHTRVSGSKHKEPKLKQLVDEIFPYIENEVDEGNKILLVVNSYEQSKMVPNYLRAHHHLDAVASLVNDNTQALEANWIKRSDVKHFRQMGFNALVAPATVIERGYNIVDSEGHSVFNRLIFLVRPMDVPREIDNTIGDINGRIYEYSTSCIGDNIIEEITKMKALAYDLWDEKMAYCYSVANKSEDEKREIVVSRLVLILQIFGRLLRIRNFDKEPPKVYFADNAFIGSAKLGFNLLKEIHIYLEQQLKDEKNGELVQLLYGAFYEALKGRR